MCSSCPPDTLADVSASARHAKQHARKAMTAARRAPASLITHEHYLQAIQRLVLRQPGLTKAQRAKLASIKLVYGAGMAGVRGVTYYSRWRQPKSKAAVPFVELCAFSQHSHVQVCGTLVHELGHVLAGHGSGHGAEWFAACAALGLGCLDRGCAPIQAAGTDYEWACFAPGLREALQALPTPTDGQPVGNAANLLGKLLGPHGRAMTLGMLKPKPCGAGHGAKGGLSRGLGSGTRNVLWECACDGSKPSMASRPVKIRHAGRDLEARCLRCHSMFELVEASLPPAHSNGGPLAPKPRKPRKSRVKAGKAAKAKRPSKLSNKARRAHMLAKPL